MSALLLLICIEERERRDWGGEGVGLMMKSEIIEITAKMLQMVIMTSPSAKFYRELD